MAWAFDPAKYQSQEAQSKHSHCQEVHQAGTYVLYNNFEMWHTWCTQEGEMVKESTTIYMQYINISACYNICKQSIKPSHKGNKSDINTGNIYYDLKSDIKYTS